MNKICTSNPFGAYQTDKQTNTQTNNQSIVDITSKPSVAQALVGFMMLPRRKSTQPRSSRVGRREVAGGRPPQDVRTPCHTPTRESHVCLHSWDCVRSGVRGSYKMTGGGILRRRKFVARRAWVRSNTPWGRGGGRTERDGRQGMHLSSIPLVRPLSSAL